MSFSRSEPAFFHDNTTKRAVVKLASSDRLVVYCGAGVTIDRTGLNWSELLARLFDREESDPTEYPTGAEGSCSAGAVAAGQR